MRLYFETDNEIDENCTNKCPWSNIAFYGELGKDCYVGSVACQECKFCYGCVDKGFVGVPNNFGKPIKLLTRKYVNCRFDDPKNKRLQFLSMLHHFKRWVKDIFKKN